MIGAAAYHGNEDMLQYLIGKLGVDFIDVKAIETADRSLTKSGPFKPELNDFTPLQLAVVTPH